jgi:hypothetical protein
VVGREKKDAQAHALRTIFHELIRSASYLRSPSFDPIVA